MFNSTPPPDAQYLYGGRYLKQGTHGYIFVWSEDQWIKTEVTLSDMKCGKSLNSDHKENLPAHHRNRQERA